MESPISLETAKSLGPVAIVVGIVVTLGVIVFKKFHKKVRIVAVDIKDGKLNISLNNRCNKRFVVTYHFRYGEFTSKKFNIVLNKKETKTVEILDELLAGDAQINEIKFVIDNVKAV